MDVGYADNAGAITCHLIGDEKLFGFLVMRHSDASRAGLRPLLLALKSAYYWCVDFRDPTAFPRFNAIPAITRIVK